jgi:hypothetical protein
VKRISIEDRLGGLPLLDIAAAGGWKSIRVLEMRYLHADEQTMLTVVLSGAQLREVKKA